MLCFNDRCIIKMYDDNYYKLIQGTFKEKGSKDDSDIGIRNFFKNETKLSQSLSRSRQKVFEYAMCNDFPYFVTLTINKEQCDRYDLDIFIKKFTQWIRDIRKKYKCQIKYLFIPENHKDGAWHLHGFLDVPEYMLEKFDISIQNEYIKNNRNNIYNWSLYEKKFGFNIIEPVRNKEATAKYATKYIVKNLGSNIDQNKKVYYASRGLKTAETIAELRPMSDIEFDYVGEYCSVKWIKSKNEVEEIIKCNT